MSRLVGHIARVHAWVLAALADPSGQRTEAPRPPRDWDELLPWWDDRRARLLEALAGDPEAPAWLPFAAYPQKLASWARRQAHEAAIHRLDAEHALGTPTVTFDPEFAADGIDELLVMVLPRRTDWSGTSGSGTVLVHAADASRLWTVRLAPGTAPVVEAGAVVPATFDAAVTVAGTADSVYRALWGRPHHATITGDSTLLAALAAP